jgi:hypothetical protein
METNDLLREIADEFHNLNLNLVELIKVLKDKNTNSNNMSDHELHETLETLTEAMAIHRSQLESKRNGATPEKIESENEYQKKQANFDQALKKLGIM